MTMWVFGYGSLVWNPGFEAQDRVIASLPDYHRSFCMRSIHHRGTDETPGLVLALDERRARSVMVLPCRWRPRVRPRCLSICANAN